MEHRWGQRTKVSMAVSLQPRRPFAILHGRMINISASGAFIRVAFPIPVLTCMKVKLPARGDDPPTTLTACVVRQTREGVGVEWCDTPSVALLAARPVGIPASFSSPSVH